MAIADRLHMQFCNSGSWALQTFKGSVRLPPRSSYRGERPTVGWDQDKDCGRICIVPHCQDLISFGSQCFSLQSTTMHPASECIDGREGMWRTADGADCGVSPF